MNNLFSRLAAAAMLCPPLLAFAQAERPNPADAKAPAPPPRHESAFSDDKPWQNAQPGDRRAPNKALGDAGEVGGGHGGHAMAPVPEWAVPAPAPAASQAAVPAHGGHHQHGGTP
jgi:hypothetical protein